MKSQSQNAKLFVLLLSVVFIGAGCASYRPYKGKFLKENTSLKILDIHNALEAESLPILETGKKLNVRLDQSSPVLDNNGVIEPFCAFILDTKTTGNYRLSVLSISEGASMVRLLVPRVFLFSLPEGKNLLPDHNRSFGQYMTMALVIRNTCKVDETVELKEGGKYMVLIASNGDFFDNPVSEGSVVAPLVGTNSITYTHGSWVVRGTNYGKFQIKIRPKNN